MGYSVFGVHSQHLVGGLHRNLHLSQQLLDHFYSWKLNHTGHNGYEIALTMEGKLK
jgi:hypothetical protein